MDDLLNLYGELYSNPSKYMSAVEHFGAGVIEEIPGDDLRRWNSQSDYNTNNYNSYGSYDDYEGDDY